MMFRLSWLIATVGTLFALTAILVLTRDLAVTNDLFKTGVAEVSDVNGVTDEALGASGELPGAHDAVVRGLPEVTGVVASLARADSTLFVLATDLRALGAALERTNKPLPAILKTIDRASGVTDGAARPARKIADRVADIERSVKSISSKLGLTEAAASRIEAKLRVLLLLPTGR